MFTFFIYLFSSIKVFSDYKIEMGFFASNEKCPETFAFHFIEKLLPHFTLCVPPNYHISVKTLSIKSIWNLQRNLLKRFKFLFNSKKKKKKKKN